MQKLFADPKIYWRSYMLRIVCALALLSALAALAIHRPNSNALAATADWPTFMLNNMRTGFNSAETIINPTSAPHLKMHWTRTISATISSEPIVANGMLYWGSWNGYEHASSLSDGHDIWATN